MVGLAQFIKCFGSLGFKQLVISLTALDLVTKGYCDQRLKTAFFKNYIVVYENEVLPNFADADCQVVQLISTPAIDKQRF